MNPLNPEMWLLPYGRKTGVGFLHPGRFWCHCRMVSWVGRRFCVLLFVVVVVPSSGFFVVGSPTPKTSLA
jgi:hypothetical protein